MSCDTYKSCLRCPCSLLVHQTYNGQIYVVNARFGSIGVSTEDESEKSSLYSGVVGLSGNETGAAPPTTMVQSTMHRTEASESSRVPVAFRIVAQALVVVTGI